MVDVPTTADLALALARLTALESRVTALETGTKPPDNPPPPTTTSAFELGLTPTSRSPVAAGVAWPDSVVNALKPCVTWFKQHTFNFGAAVGDHRGPLDFSTLDVRLSAAKRIGIPGSKILVTLYAAPVWVTGQADWSYNVAAPMDNGDARTQLVTWAKAVTDYCYGKYGVLNYDYYNEMKGYNTFFVGDRYMRDYNAIWDGVFAGNTKGLKLGGPYSVLIQHQNKDWGVSEVSGDWGSVDPAQVGGFYKFKQEAHGFDFLSVDLSMGDENGNRNGGNYNPKGLPIDLMQQYFLACGKFCRKIAGDKPVIASEFYFGGSFATCADLFKQGLGGNGVVMAWSEPGLLELVNGSGTRTSLGNDFAAYRAAGKAA